MGAGNPPSPIIFGGTGGIGKLLPPTSAGYIQTDASGNLSTIASTPSGAAAVTDWSNSLAFTASPGFGTVTSPDYRYKRIGDTMLVVGSWINGTIAASNSYIQLPAGYTIDTTKMPAFTTEVGLFYRLVNTGNFPSANEGPWVLFYDGSTNNQLFLAYTSTSSDYSKSLTSTLMNAGETSKFNFTIPITEWNGGGASQNISARYYASSTAVTGSLATVVWTTQDYDTNSAMSSGVYTVPSSGKLSINTALELSGTFALNSTVDLVIQVNGTTKSAVTAYAAGAVINFPVFLSDILNVSGGDTVRVQIASSAITPAIIASNTKNYISLRLS